MTGIDYCSYAIELAQSIASDEHLDIEYQVRRVDDNQLNSLASSDCNWESHCFFNLEIPGFLKRKSQIPGDVTMTQHE